MLDELLLSVAFDEFVEYGYAGASLTRIVERARMSKTTLYSRYASKEALFRAVVFSQIDHEKPYRALHSDTNPRDLAEGLERFAIDMLDASFEHRTQALNRVILGEVHRFPELAEAAEARMQRGVERIRQFLEDSSRLEGRRMENPGYVAEAFIHMIRGWYLNQLIAAKPTSKAEIRAWARRAVRALVRAAPGW
ncbi:hypothetical protein B2G71_13940 [Novosphingobium sp. PC22D]|uniref:TetR/AcrR family transcriptional regulator n=1 Tax=Novosphingobium sp. PC22D TaxID=1962403 RepID=UPI000BFAC08F|nr:TetR/AcrR family transcriptional regulator [Novosphingobium sp. PC22D]PEQ11886.1 hypothetical protein B2G71_13940 [Novosphingobium sp. PC22D]